MNENKMKLEINETVCTIDIDKIAQGLHDLHFDYDKYTLLKFGMLDAKIMRVAENDIKKTVESTFPNNLESHKGLIADFLRSVNRQIAVGIYSRTNMVV